MNDKIKKNVSSGKKEDVNATFSERKGIAGFLETVIRRFRMISHLVTLLPLYALCFLAMGISAAPGIYFFDTIRTAASTLPEVLYYISVGTALITAYFMYGILLLFVVPLFNFLMPFRLKPFRGGFFTLETIPWYFHNAYTYMVRYTFLEFVTPTPLNMLFYKMMGMKIGKGSYINTTNISDPGLIELGDNVTIGGSVYIIAHYASKGYLIVDKVRIHNRVTIGLKATIMGDVEIGEGAVIGPHEVILPKSRIPAGRKPFESLIKKEGLEKDQPSQDFL